MHQIDPEMKACMDACHECHVTCLHMAMNHCLEAGGRHAEPQHMKIMADCAQICAVAIDFMARKSEHHRHICRECAEICRAAHLRHAATQSSIPSSPSQLDAHARQISAHSRQIC